MFLNPLARLIVSLILFLLLIMLIEDWITINMRGIIKRWRNKHNRRINK